MRSQLLTAAGIVVVAVFATRLLDVRDGASAKASETESIITERSFRAASVTPAWGNEVRVVASPDRQFYVDASVNRHESRFLIDTGASFVALRDSDARAAGIYTSWTDYKYPVHTANGETKAAYVTIDEIEVGDLRIEGVKAFILQDEQLNVNLLGMSFLSRLESIEARKGELLLRG